MSQPPGRSTGSGRRRRPSRDDRKQREKGSRQIQAFPIRPGAAGSAASRAEASLDGYRPNLGLLPLAGVDPDAAVVPVDLP